MSITFYYLHNWMRDSYTWLSNIMEHVASLSPSFTA